jgi:hypothetical protein
MNTAFELLTITAALLVGAIVAGYVVACLGWLDGDDDLTEEDRLDWQENHGRRCEMKR